jgi:hypothetical protein
MAHLTEIIKMEQLSDEAVGVTVRCCGNVATDSVLTIYGIAKMDAMKLHEYIDKHHNRVAEKCKGMTSGKQLLDVIVAKIKHHEG